MQVVLLRSGDEALLTETAKAFNDEAVSHERAAMLLNDPCFFMVVARLGSSEIMGRIYGHVLHRFSHSDLLLYEVDVADEHRRKGVGKAMLEFVKSFARERNYRETWVLTEEDNAPAQALYASAGGVLEAFPTAMYVFYPER